MVGTFRGQFTKPLRYSGLLRAGFKATDGQEPHGRLFGAVVMATDGQEPHGRLFGTVGIATDGQAPHGGLSRQSAWL